MGELWYNGKSLCLYAGKMHRQTENYGENRDQIEG